LFGLINGHYKNLFYAGVTRKLQWLLDESPEFKGHTADVALPAMFFNIIDCPKTKIDLLFGPKPLVHVVVGFR